jgi:hypothetical protein
MRVKQLAAQRLRRTARTRPERIVGHPEVEGGDEMLSRRVPIRESKDLRNVEAAL